jgi:two-component system cell cycle sensor histidine kinase/response regulator CckA
MCTQLARLGYQVQPFARAEDALTALSSGGSSPPVGFDILLTDVVLGGMSGPTLARQLRQQNGVLKVLYVSGYTNGEILAHGLAEGAARLLYKPFTMRELAQAVRATLEAAS